MDYKNYVYYAKQYSKSLRLSQKNLDEIGNISINFKKLNIDRLSHRDLRLNFSEVVDLCLEYVSNVIDNKKNNM